jgi:hypothetical protein
VLAVGLPAQRAIAQRFSALALLRHADCVAQCPLSGAKRKTFALIELSGFDPDVWSGRALQVDFAEPAVSGLASMYPAF